MSPLRRSTRAGKQADPSAASPPPAPVSPSKTDRKRKRGSVLEESQHASTDIADVSMTNGDRSPSKSPAKTRAASSLPQDASEDQEQYAKLLGIRVGVAERAESSTSHPIADYAKLELVLLEADAVKLQTVLSSLAPEVMDLKRPNAQNEAKLRKAKSKSSERGSALLPFSTLKEGFVEGTQLRDLREHALALRKPLISDSKLQQRLSSEPWSASSDAKEIESDRSKLCALTLTLSLLDQLARRYRESDASAKGQVEAALVEQRAEALKERQKQAKMANAGVKAEPEEEDATFKELAELDAQEAEGKYALHMRLPKGDFFTRSALLDKKSLEKIDAGQADLVAVAPDTKSHLQGLRSEMIPTLGERSRPARKQRSAKAAKEEVSSQDTLKPVTFLNYGTYASYAPTYDSAGATLSQAASSTLWRGKALQRAAELSVWGSKASHDEELADTKEILAGPQKPLAAQELNLDALDKSLDPTLLESGLEQLEKDEKISAQLEHNLILLKKLQAYQWDRLKRSYCPPTTGLKKAEEDEKPEEVKPSAEEDEIAGLLLDSLSSLLDLQPHAFEGGKMIKGIPDQETLSKFSQTIGAIDPLLQGEVERGYWGTQDESLCTPSTKTKPGVPIVIRDNMTVKLTEESESKALRHGVGKDRGKGMLERFASSRTYSTEDKHDIDPVARSASPEKPPVSRTRSGGLPSAQKPRYPPAQASPIPNGMSPRQQGTPQRGAAGNASFAFRSQQGGFSYGTPPHPQQMWMQHQRPPSHGSSYHMPPYPQQGSVPPPQQHFHPQQQQQYYVQNR